MVGVVDQASRSHCLVLVLHSPSTRDHLATYPLLGKESTGETGASIHPLNSYMSHCKCLIVSSVGTLSSLLVS